jgi:Bacterial Ig domain
MITRHIRGGLWLAISFSAAFILEPTAAQQTRAMAPSKASVIDHWTAERRATAIPRDLVIDPRGLGYLKRPDGSLAPHGHVVAAGARAQNQPPVTMAAGGSGDGTPPVISNLNPAANATVGAAAYTFSATVTDPSGVKSVTFRIQKVGATPQSFAAVAAGSGNWTANVQGLTDGDWNWWVEAKDGAPRGGNAGSSGVVAFKVSTGTGGSSSDTVSSAHWTSAGYVKSASGRLYFEMPGNAKRRVWWGYVCSGTVATDSTTGRSVVITAAHCVYDDVNKAFARNVMFIPDQDGTTGAATDRNCANDPIGCWVASVGVVDVNWTTRAFPDNVAWDYGYYVVADSGAHAAGINAASDILDDAAGSLPISFGTAFHDDALSRADYTRALGYSYSEDPKLMYCAEDMTTEGAVNWWLPSCALSGGSSGGPWVQPLTPNGFGDIISVNSWGYTSRPGMAGPMLVGTSASCVFERAKTGSLQNAAPPDGDAGIAVSCP